MEKITSRSNEKLKHAASLAASAKKRAEGGEFLLEGARLCLDAAENGIEIKQAFFTTDALEKYAAYTDVICAKAAECFELSPDAAQKLSDTQSPQGVFAVCAMPDRSFETVGIDAGGRYIALECVQDPANLGAVCRTAEAMGIAGVIVCGGCDIYNPKALRAAMGCSLRMNIITADNLPALIKTADSLGMLTLATTPRAGALDIRRVNFDRGAVCVVGNEGSGVSEEAAAACRASVTIPMGGRAESLNAAAAAAIIIWESVRGTNG